MLLDGSYLKLTEGILKEIKLTRRDLVRNQMLAVSQATGELQLFTTYMYIYMIHQCNDRVLFHV